MMLEDGDTSGITIDPAGYARLGSRTDAGRTGRKTDLLVAGLLSLNNWGVYRTTFDDGDVYVMSHALAFEQTGLRVVA